MTNENQQKPGSGKKSRRNSTRPTNRDDDDNVDLVDVAQLRSLIAGGKTDVELSRKALAAFCRIARRQRFPTSNFPIEMLAWIADAFEKHLSGDEPNLAKSLGLAARGKPADLRIRRRDALIARDVLARMTRSPNDRLADNKGGAGIFTKVAERFGVSDSIVKAIWYDDDMQRIGRSFLELERTLRKEKWLDSGK